MPDRPQFSTTMFPIPPDPYEEFLSLPLGQAPSVDPRFNVRRLPATEFERAYDCVDVAFGVTRPRIAFDWLYRKNPYGRAQVWVVEERASGRILKTGARFPWPIWRGREPLSGALAGDAGTVPDWQRKGLSNIRRDVRKTHPWQGLICSFSGPNRSSRIVARKSGRSDALLGMLRGGVLLLRAQAPLERLGLSSGLAAVAGSFAASAVSTWQRLAFRRHPVAGLHFEAINRCGVEFDDVTAREMDFPGYWCPHNADFLNWRYLDHPLETYTAFMLSENDVPIGYSVLRTAGEQATLSEFAVASRPFDRAAELLARTAEKAREAGCAYLNFFGPPTWRHWGLFRRAGMLPYRTDNCFEVTYDADSVGSRNFRNWQVTPGDRDYH